MNRQILVSNPAFIKMVSVEFLNDRKLPVSAINSSSKCINNGSSLNDTCFTSRMIEWRPFSPFFSIRIENPNIVCNL